MYNKGTPQAIYTFTYMKDNSGFFQVSVKGLFFDTEGRLMMIQEKYGKWEIPGGRIEKGEEFLDCLIRECYEETGLKPEILSKEPSIIYPTLDHEGNGRIMIFYKINFPDLNFRPSSECERIAFFAKKDLKDLSTFNQTRKLFDLI